MSSPRGRVHVVPPLLSMVAVFMAAAVMVATAQMFRPGIMQQNDDEHIISRRSQECSDKQTADLYLLVDGSSSVGPGNFHLVLKFLAKLVDKLDIGKDKVRVGMVQYSGDMRSPKIKKEFDMGQYADKEKLKAAILGTKYMRGFTFTGAALRHTLQLFKSQGRPGVGKILVLVTDGEANDKVKDPSDEVKSSGIVLFSVGVGKADRKELALMASPPVDKHMFHATDFAGLDSIITALTSTVCTVVQEAKVAVPVTAATQAVALPSKEVCSSKQTADLYLLVDGSSSVGPGNFHLVLKFLAKLVDKLDIGKDTVRVGMVQYSGDMRSPKIKKEFDMGQYADKEKLKAAIQDTKYMRGFTFTGAALRHTLQLFKSQGRPGVGKILVLVTDGEANDKVKDPSDEVKSSGIVLFSVGVGKADRKELALMASPPVDKHMFHATNFAGLDSIITTLTSTVCTVVQEAQTPAPTPPPGPFAKLDVIFAIDGSAGVAAADFTLMKGFVAQIVQGLSVGAAQVRVGLVQLSGKQGSEFKLGQFSSRQEVVAAVGKVSAHGGGRAIGATVQFALATAFSQAEGGRAGEGVPQVLVIITGGASSDAVAHYRGLLRAHGVRSFVIGIGAFQLLDLQRLPSDPIGLHLYAVGGYAQLLGIAGQVTSVIVRPAISLDLVFMVDGSLGAAWGAVRAFVSHLLLYVQGGGGVLRVAFVQFAGDVTVELYLDQGTEVAAVLAKLQSVQQLSGAGGRNLGKAVSFVGGTVLSAAKGGRGAAGVNQVVVLFVAGPSTDEPSQALYALKASGVRVLALDLGGLALAQLGGLVSTPFNLHYYKLSGGAQVLPLALGRILHTSLYAGVTRGAQYADIVFYLDSSATLGEAGFVSLKAFLVQVLSYLQVGRYTVRVAVVQVGGAPVAAFQFNSHSERSALVAAVSQLKAVGGARNVGAALSLGYATYVSQASDAGLQPAQVGILLTGGASADNAAKAAAQLQASGVRLFVVGVGSGVDQALIQGVASFPYALHSFTVSDYTGLSKVVVTSLVKYIFRPVVSGDLVFLIDGSTSVEQQTFHLIKKFVERIITNYYYIGGSLRVAVYQFGGVGSLEVPLGNQNDADSLTHTISNIEKVSGPRNLGASLTYVLSNIYKETTTTKLSQSIFIISGGKSDDDVTGAVQLLRERGITVTGVGHTSSQLDAVVSTSSHWFKFTESGTILKSFYNVISGLFFTVPVVPIPKTTQAPTTATTTTTKTAPTTTTLAPTTPKPTTKPAPVTTVVPVTVPSPYNSDNRYGDVVFVVDGSSGISAADFGTVRTIVSQIITGLQVGPDNTRVALVTIGGTPKVDIFLNSLSGKAELLTAVEKLVPVGGPLNLGAALQVVVNSVLKPEKGSRIHLGAPTMLVTILGGKPADDVSGSVVTLNGLGVRHVVLSGGYQDTKVLNSIATSSRLVKTWSSFQSILNFNLGHFVYKTKEKASVVFVVDTSTITADELKVVKTFIVGIAHHLNLAPDSVRLSVVSYGANYQKLVGPAEINSPKDLEAKLGSVLVPTGGATNTGKALTYTITDLLAKEPADVSKSVVLITSGPSSDSVAPIPELLQKHVVSLFAVGVKSSDVKQLQTLVSRGGYYYQLSDYSLLSMIHSQIIIKALYLPAIQQAVTTTVVTNEFQYKLVPGNRDADVVFVVDGSSEVSDANFALVRTIVSQIIAGLDVGPDSTRVALVTVGGTPRADISFNSFPGKAELLAAVGKLAPAGGPRNLGAALQLVANSVLKPDKGSRSQLGSTTIVYTILGGKPADDVTAGASLLRGMGVLVSAFGAGYQDSSVLSSIATSSSQVFTWSSFQDLVTKSSSLTGNSLYLPKRKASVTFVVDTSSTITADELKVVKTFIVGMANRLNLAPDSVRLSVVSYGADYQKLVGPAEINSPKDLEAKLGSVLVPTGGATNTGKALTYTITDLLAKEPEDATKSVVLITSGPSSDSVAPIAELLQKHVVSLFAVGVKSSNVQQLQTLVSRGGYYYQLSDYSLLFRLQGQMANKVLYLPAIQKATTTIVVATESQYKVVPGNRDADVVFVVDGSSEVSDANFALVRTIVSQIIAGLDVGPDATRVALVTVGGTPRADISFHSFPGKAELLAAVGKLAPAGGPRNLGAALQLVANSVLKPDKGSRSQLGSTTIVYTILGGKPADDVTAGASLLRGMGVLVSAFGAGYKDSSVLSSIATSSSQVFTWSSFQDLVTKSSSLTGNSLYLPKRKASVTFVVDTSSTIKADELKVVKKFIVGMANRLNLAPDSVRLSVVSYGADYQKLVGPAEINSPKDLEAKLGSVLVPTGGATNTGKALTYAITDLLAKEPEDATKSVVLITSGPSSDSVAPIAELLQKHVVSLFAVGVKSSDVQQLQTLVSRGGYYYQLSDYSLLFHLQGQMVNKALYLPAIVKAENMQVVIDTTKLMADKTRIIGGGSKGLKAITCTTAAKEFLTDSAAVVFCPPGCQAVKGYKVKGSYIYSLDSMVCVAAAHAGVVIPEVGGVVSVVKKPGVLSFDGSVINSISSHAAPGEPLSFVFKGCPCA
ncbi:collagen alpha-3(VI) chain-like [Petromyzon marinus]|uniref:collagen alpha-3(VI) chain-like n=1 Tax=Petromyzon marinus TaxID=7757 RepID=UPI003F6F4511